MLERKAFANKKFEQKVENGDRCQNSESKLLETTLRLWYVDIRMCNTKPEIMIQI